MSLVVFPDLQHPERADVDTERYIAQLIAHPLWRGDWTEDSIMEIIVEVHDWMLDVIREADAKRMNPIHALQRATWPTAPMDRRHLLDTILQGMMKATCRELQYRGKSRVERANERFRSFTHPPYTRRQSHRVRFTVPEK